MSAKTKFKARLAWAVYGDNGKMALCGNDDPLILSSERKAKIHKRLGELIHRVKIVPVKKK